MLGDRAVALPPLNRTLARAALERTRVARLLAGYRDHPPAQVDAVCDVMIAVAQMLADLPELAELDISGDDRLDELPASIRAPRDALSAKGRPACSRNAL